jgi:ATP-binding cassette subfamily B protein
MDADMIIVMKNGEIDGVGSHDQLIENNAIYQEIYSIQNKVGDENAA